MKMRLGSVVMDGDAVDIEDTTVQGRARPTYTSRRQTERSLLLLKCRLGSTNFEAKQRSISFTDWS